MTVNNSGLKIKKPSILRGLFGSFPGIVLILLVILVPVFLLLVRSFTEPTFGLQNYTRLASDPTVWTVLVRTFRTAAIVTAVTLLLAYPYAYVMTRVSPNIRTLMVALVLLPYWTSLMARTFAWLILLQENGVIQQFLAFLGFSGVKLAGTNIAVTIAMVQMLLPFMALPLYSNMQGIDRNLLSAAQSLGANRTKAFWKVFAPLSLPGVVGGAVLVFVLSLGYYVTPRILGSPKQAMVAELIVTRVDRVLDFAGAGALSLIVIIVTLVLLWLMSRVVNPSKAIGLSD